MTEKPFAPATERNSKPILDVIRHEFHSCQSVLEIGSGTGQHAVAFGANLNHLIWQTSDRDENHDAINAWLNDAALRNVLQPVSLDVLTAEMPRLSYDAVFSANTSHIMSFAAVEKMFSLVSGVLKEEGVFCLYGPFAQDGEFSTPGNAEFDRSLRNRDPEMGIRNLEDLDRLGLAGCLCRVRLYAMPANNNLVVWIKRSSGSNV
jgi:SAM-dependent methyltransferase